MANGDNEYGGAEFGGGTGVPASSLTGSLAQKIKKQIVLNLNALIQAGTLNSVLELDYGKDPLTIEPPSGYPFALVGMPSVTSDYEDQSTNRRNYKFDTLIVASYQALADQNEGIEGIIDAVLNQFDNNFTLAGAANATVLPVEVISMPVSTATKSLVCFLVTLRCQALFDITNPTP
jgi:hypothetical protein